MALDEHQAQTVQEEAGGEDSEPDIWEDLGSVKATSRAPSTKIGSWGMLAADERVMAATAVVVECQQACFEFYQKNSLRLAHFSNKDEPSMFRLFDKLGVLGSPGTGVKDAYGWDLTSWICKIRHCGERRSDRNSPYTIAMDNWTEFAKTLNDAETIPRCLAYISHWTARCTRMQFKQESACVIH